MRAAIIAFFWISLIQLLIVCLAEEAKYQESRERERDVVRSMFVGQYTESRRIARESLTSHQLSEGERKRQISQNTESLRLDELWGSQAHERIKESMTATNVARRQAMLHIALSFSILLVGTFWMTVVYFARPHSNLRSAVFWSMLASLILVVLFVGLCLLTGWGEDDPIVYDYSLTQRVFLFGAAGATLGLMLGAVFQFAHQIVGPKHATGA